MKLGTTTVVDQPSLDVVIASLPVNSVPPVGLTKLVASVLKLGSVLGSTSVVRAGGPLWLQHPCPPPFPSEPPAVQLKSIRAPFIGALKTTMKSVEAPGAREVRLQLTVLGAEPTEQVSVGVVIEMKLS